jgi:MoaA/NifB/PqqE/SkfB family radical SAM enzyme
MLSLPAVRNVRSIDLDMAESCNLACAHCFKWQQLGEDRIERSREDPLNELAGMPKPPGKNKLDLFAG